MKTALKLIEETLIERIEHGKEQRGDTAHLWRISVMAFESIKHLIEVYQQEEMRLIREAFEAGQDNTAGYEDGIDYYNHTYIHI